MRGRGKGSAGQTEADQDRGVPGSDRPTAKITRLEALEHEHKRTQELLRKERKTFFHILQKAPYGVILIDGHGKYVYVNPEFTNITGYRFEDVPTGRDLLSKAYPDLKYREKVRKAWKTDILQKGVTWVFSFVRKDRETREIEFKPTLLDDGRVLVTLSDITERKLAEDELRNSQQELDRRVKERTAELSRSNRLLKKEILERERVEKAQRESEERYRSLVKQSSDGIFIMDPKTGKVHEVNDQFCKMLGYREEDVRQLMLADFVKFENRAIQSDLHRALESGQDIFGLRQYKRADGSLLDVEVHATLINYGNERVVMVNVRDVSERLQAEKAVNESSRLYRTIFETTGCATIMIDDDMTISVANTEFEKLSGYWKDEIQGKKNWMEFLAPSEVERIARYHLIRRVDPGAVPRNYEFQFVNRAGEIKTIYMTVDMVPDTTKSVASLLDITYREKSERALRESERRYRALFEDSTDAIYINTLDGKFIDCNKPMLDLFGYTREEMFQMTSSAHYVNPQDRAKYQQAMMKTGFVKDYETRFIRKDGTEIDCLLSSTYWRSSDDRILGYQGIIRDITKIKKAEQALRATKDELEHMVAERTAELQSTNERLVAALTRAKRVEELLRKGAERYRDLFWNSPIGIYRTNPDGRILMANPTLVRMLGFSSFAELNQNESEEDDYEPNYYDNEFRERLARDGRVRGFEASWEKSDGTVIFVSENAKAIKGEDGNVIYYEGTVEDITEQKRAEERIHAYQEELRSLASELSLAEERERRRIAQMLHDDIGQLLAVSKMKLGGLLQSSDAPEVKAEAGEVRQHVEQAIKYTRSLTTELSPPILYELGLEAALEWLGEQMQEQHGFEVSFESDNQAKSIDEEAGIFLFTSVRELLVNIAKHAAARHVRLSIRKGQEDVVIEVEDDGKGFSSAVAGERLGGFGLFSIKERLQHLGGRMDISSSPSHGTLITLSAPARMKKKGTRRG